MELKGKKLIAIGDRDGVRAGDWRMPSLGRSRAGLYHHWVLRL